MPRRSSSDPRPIPTWSSSIEACRVVLDRRHLRATTRIALVVGTVLFSINQLDVVLAGNASTATWEKSSVTYLVPFIVSNLGILTATRRRS
ncbi:MAG: nitrate/nitrite transporter NrtS [Acidimicrobiia bacterium]